MKRSLSKYITAVVLLAAPVALIAQRQLSNQLPRYAVKDLGTLGGTFSVAIGINNSGWVMGNSTVSGDTATNAFLQHLGVMSGLGTLGGANSSAGGLAERGQAVGVAESSVPDPMGENFCFFGTGATCLPFLWQDGAMTALPTLGGTNGNALGINNKGQIGGVAENSTLDSTCPSPEFQSEPVIWAKGAIQPLPTFPGDPDGFVNSINSKGQAVGGSGGCWTTFPAFSIHALLWQNGKAKNLGTLGGTLFSQANVINERSQVVGASNVSGDTSPYAPFGNPYTHAFFWQNGVMKDLGTLPGDSASFAISLNNEGQAVGFGSRAIIWLDSVAIDLNSLVPGPPFSPLYLLNALAINDRGEVVGLGLASNGELHAVLAVPCDEDHVAAAPCNNQVATEVDAVGTFDGTVGASAPRGSSPALAGRFGGKLGRPQTTQVTGRRVPAFGGGAVR